MSNQKNNKSMKKGNIYQTTYYYDEGGKKIPMRKVKKGVKVHSKSTKFMVLHDILSFEGMSPLLNNMPVYHFERDTLKECEADRKKLGFKGDYILVIR